MKRNDQPITRRFLIGAMIFLYFAGWLTGWGTAYYSSKSDVIHAVILDENDLIKEHYEVTPCWIPADK